MVDNKLIKQKLNELEDFRESLQGKTKRRISDIIFIILALIGIAYFIYLERQGADAYLEVLTIIIAIVISNIFFKMSVTNKRIDAVIKLLELEQVAQQKCAEEIRLISNEPEVT